MSDSRSYSENNFGNRRGKQLREESEAFFFSSNCYVFFGNKMKRTTRNYL